MANQITFSDRVVKDITTGSGSWKDGKQPCLYLKAGKRDKVFYFVKRIAGKLVWEKLGKFPELGVSEARRAVQAKIGAVAAGNFDHTTVRYTLNQIWDRWRKERGQYKRSNQNDLSNWTNHLQIFADMFVQDITRDHVQQLRKQLQSTPVAFNRVRSLLYTLCRYAIAELGVTMQNPCDGVPKYRETPRNVIVPPDRLSAFLAALDMPGRPQDLRDICRLQLHTGSRPGNVMSMAWSEIDFDHAVWTISPEKAKGGKEMHYHLSPVCLDILRRRHWDRQSKVWVFPSSSQNGHILSIKKSFKQLVIDAGMPELHPHDLRRTFGTVELNVGGSIEEVSASLNHADIGVTQKVYAKLLPDRIKTAVNRASDFIAAAESTEQQPNDTIVKWMQETGRNPNTVAADLDIPAEQWKQITALPDDRLPKWLLALIKAETKF